MKKNKSIIWAALLSLMLGVLSGSAGFSQISEPYAELVRALHEDYLAHPRQKVFLHTDKDTYHVHETMWLKAYLVDASDHLPDTLSGNLYVQLVDSEGKHVRNLVLKLSEGLAHGQMSFPDSLPDGNYLLRAFTNWMFNFSEDFFFTRDIYVHNPEQANYITRGAIRSNRRFNRDVEQRAEALQFSVFPEGGHWVDGLPSRLAFKAADGLGRGVGVRGRIIDQEGREITTLSAFHDGMGCFTLTPEPGVVYRAEIITPTTDRVIYPLPLPMPYGYIMRVETGKDSLVVDIRRNFNPDEFNMPDGVFVLAHSGGKALYTAAQRMDEDHHVMSIPTSHLPTGVTHITLFDGQAFPVAERLVFVNHGDMARVEVDSYLNQSMDSTFLSLDVFYDTKPGFASEGSFSMAVLSMEHASEYTQTDIASYMLLTSDIAATVSNPAYYLQSGDEEVAEAAELLMLTHGWRRFSWEHLLAGQTLDIRHGFASGLAVRGSVRALSSAEPAAEVLVEMIVGENIRNRYTTKTDKEGRFVFANIDHEGTFRVRLSTPDHTNGRNLWIDLEAARYPEVSYVPGLRTRPVSITQRGDNWQRTRAPLTWLRPHHRARPQMDQPYFGRPDQVIYSHDIQGHYNHMIELLMGRVVGLTIEGSNLTFRGQSSLLMDNEPLYVVDGIMVHKSTFMTVQPSDVERLEILRGSSSAIFGSRGGNGVLIAFTKKGDETSRRTFEFSVGGFHQPRDFYLSKIQSEIYETNHMARTLYWDADLRLKPDVVNSVHIPVEQIEGGVLVVVEGLTNEGKPVYSRIFIK